MAVLSWDGTGERKFETGVDHAVLYPLNTTSGAYDSGVAWNGITAINEKPDGAASNKQYADNIVYANLRSTETYGGTIEAFTYPDEWEQCDGSAAPVEGVSVGQQGRATFGLSYRTRVGDDVDSSRGYKLHLVYGATASPSEKDYTTVNDSPAPIGFSWDFDTQPLDWGGTAPTATLTIDSTTVDASALSDLEDFLYGTAGTDPSLPSPDAVVALFNGTIVSVSPTAPTIASDVITIPTVTGVIYQINGVTVTGTRTITVDTIVTAKPANTYVFTKPYVDAWLMKHT